MKEYIYSIKIYKRSLKDCCKSIHRRIWERLCTSPVAGGPLVGEQINAFEWETKEVVEIEVKLWYNCTEGCCGVVT